LITALREFYLNEMKLKDGEPPGIQYNPKLFVEEWLQPYTQHLSFMLSALHGTAERLDGYPLSYSADYDDGNGDRYKSLERDAINRQIEESLYCLMCLPTSLWRPAALLAMQQFRVYMDGSTPRLREGVFGKSLLAFLSELECLAVYLEISGLRIDKKQHVYAQVRVWGATLASVLTSILLKVSHIRLGAIVRLGWSHGVKHDPCRLTEYYHIY
jgi:hypothetical protein